MADTTGPPTCIGVQVALDTRGNPTAWDHVVVGQSILNGTPFEPFAVKNGIDGASVEGAANLPYAVPNMSVELNTTETGVPVLWWRVVGSSHTAYATEAFIDEIAHAAGKDPFVFRQACSNTSAPQGGAGARGESGRLGQPLPKGKGRGIAVAEAFGSYVAQVAEVTVGPNGEIKVDRVVCAVDCGTPINPDVITAQMEGGIGFGLGAALYGAITLKDGRVERTNFDAYDAGTDEMPKVEVHIVQSPEAPTGVGEPGVAPVGPAVANAVFAVTGKRLRVLPFAGAGGTV